MYKDMISSTQQLLVIGSIFLLSYLILTFHRSNTSQLDATFNNEAIINATTAGQSLLDEIQSRAFDEFTVTKSAEKADSLTSSNSLGTESGESNSTSFDDIDDYDGFTRTDSVGELGNFNLLVDVYYITYPGAVKTNSKSFSKQIDVFVTNSYLASTFTDTIKLQQIVSY
ncbi:MAG: hypothetical protein PVH88_13390 [Ignavibacteria bacterium]|jgi:hypothetical protein